MAVCAPLPEELHILHTKLNYENKKFPVAYAVSNNIFCSMPLSLAERTLHIRNTPCIGNQYMKGGSRATRNALAVSRPPSYGPTAILQKAIYGNQWFRVQAATLRTKACLFPSEIGSLIRVIRKLGNLFLSGEKISSILCFTRTSITYLFHNKKVRSLVRFTKKKSLAYFIKNMSLSCFTTT